VFEIVAGVEEDEGEIEPSSIVCRQAVSVQSLQEKLGTQVIQVWTVLTVQKFRCVFGFQFQSDGAAANILDPATFEGLDHRRSPALVGEVKMEHLSPEEVILDQLVLVKDIYYDTECISPDPKMKQLSPHWVQGLLYD
jgi:hypothetical protein